MLTDIPLQKPCPLNFCQKFALTVMPAAEYNHSSALLICSYHCFNVTVSVKKSPDCSARARVSSLVLP
jgi:hypothetical protein